MKQLSAILLFIAFSFRPAYQIAEIGYYELNIDYIIKNYCVNKDKPEMHCNGKCYLNKQLNKLRVPGIDKTSPSISDSFLPVFFQEAFKYSFDWKFQEPAINNWPRPQLPKIGYISRIEHPPSGIV